jgi:pimeloyl-ACP methyl ester carboxylesterase
MAHDILERMPKARLVEIAGAYHHLVLDAPAAFNRALDEFLGSTGL